MKASYHITRNFREERSNSLMDCNNNQRNACTCRPQMQTPPCMNTNCGCGCGNGNMPIQPRPSRPAQQVMPAQCQRPATPPPCQPSTMPLPCQQPCQTPVMPMMPTPAQNIASAPTLCAPVQEDRLTGMPIAMAYVPWQRWRQTYSLEQGLSRGTIFPELDLPFVMGRCR